jgi:predicted house-cleaning noncanonical NTP pyrophosphatase (MazG superfamily)/diadenosine tetraphosphate (Ap4A) HIT family hydrolase
VVRYVSCDDLLRALLEKAREELDEFAKEPSLEEFVDVVEVVDAIGLRMGFAQDAIVKARSTKRDANGAFGDGTILEGIYERSATCEFCKEFESGICQYLTPPRCRVLHETANFVVMPALGSFVEGYALVCSKAHVPSMASFGGEVLQELQALVTFAVATVSNLYGPCVVFEHGMASCRVTAGGCIDHAHIHLIPATVDLTPFLRSKFAVCDLGGFENLAGWFGRPYILAQSQLGDFIVGDPLEGLPSQFLRRQVAELVGKGELWDWAAYLGLPEMDRTFARLQVAFGAATPDP